MTKEERAQQLKEIARDDRQARPKKRYVPFFGIAGGICAICAMILLITGFSRLEIDNEEYDVLPYDNELSGYTSVISNRAHEYETSGSNDAAITGQVVTVRIPARMSGVTSQQDADIRAEAYRFYYGTLTGDGDTAYAMSETRRDEVLATLENAIWTQTLEIQNDDNVTGIEISDDYMQTVITVSVLPESTAQIKTAEKLLDLIEPYGYFNGYSYINPSVTFESEEGISVITPSLLRAGVTE